jgi:pimeloyl-ACP methyl ester carboxylesterase
LKLVLLPGMDGTGVLFRPLVDALPPELEPIVVAYPSDEPLSYGELLPLVRRTLPAGDDFIVLGESFSGPLALTVAAENPPGLAGVVLAGSFVTNPIRSLPAWAGVLSRPWLFRLVPTTLRRWNSLGLRARSELRALFAEAQAPVRPAVWALRGREILAVDARSALRDCPVPVLYLAGRQDRIVRAHNLELIRRLRPDVQVLALDAPHLLLQTAPSAAAAAIYAFASGVRSCTIGVNDPTLPRTPLRRPQVT